MQDMRGEDWDVRYKGNRFSFLGNGISQAEWDDTCDLGYYVRDFDDGERLSRRGRMKERIRSGTQPVRELHAVCRPGVVNLPKRGVIEDSEVTVEHGIKKKRSAVDRDGCGVESKKRKLEEVGEVVEVGN